MNHINKYKAVLGAYKPPIAVLVLQAVLALHVILGDLKQVLSGLKPPIITIFCAAIIFFNLSHAQNEETRPQKLLEKGRQYYSLDQLDSAIYFYNQAYDNGSKDIQIQAIGGMLSVYILQSQIAKGDSLIKIGDQLALDPSIQLDPLCYYKIRKGEFYRANSKFQEALNQHQEVLALSKDLEGGELTQADALYYTALTFERLAAYDSSLIYVDRAYQLYKDHLDTTSVKFGSIYNGMGACYYRANRFQEAKNFYLKSKKIAEDRLGPVSTDLAMCLNNLSSIARSEEDYDQAVEYGERSIKIYNALKDENGLAGSYYSLGVYHYFLGDYGRAKNYLEECISIRERLFDKNHYSLIGPYEVLGIVLEESGNYEKTLQYLKAAQPIIKFNYGNGSISEGTNYENVALCYQNTHKLDSALHFIQLSNQILEQQLPDNDYFLANHYFNYASIQYQRNNFQEARQHLSKSNQIRQNLGMTTSTEYAQNIALDALMYAEQKDWKNADLLFEQALEIIRFPQELRNQNDSFKIIPNSLWLLNEYSDYLFKKYQATNKDQTLQLFKKYSNVYLDLSDKFRQQFNDPYTKSILIKDNAEVYNRNIGIYQHLYQKTSKEEFLNAAYQFAEYGRTCQLRDLQDEKIKSYAGIPDSFLVKESALKKEISALTSEYMDQPDDSDLKQKLFAAKEALNVFIKNTLDINQRYYDLKFNSTVPQLDKIQSKLKRGENLIEYMQDDTAYYALLVNPKQSDLFYLGNRLNINNLIEQWKEQVMSQNREASKLSGQKLYETLWRPFNPSLERERVILIPTGSLFYLNFETLPSGNNSSQFLVQDYNISYALSITIQFSEENKTKDGLLVSVAPGFEEEVKKRYQDQLDSLEVLDREYLRTVRQPWSLGLAKKLKKKFSNLSFTGINATESRIKENMQKGKILYFGTHAIANSDDPLRSKLVLAKEAGPQTEDGYLHAYELYGIPLEADLTILNACESGLGDIQEGEGMISLAYSIHYAGCPSTIMSLWKVDEKISTQITADFLQYLSQGLSKSEALRQAKLDYLDTAKNGMDHPFYWGGMILMGQDGAVVIKKKIGYWWWILGVGIAISAYFLLRRKNGTQV